MNKNDKVATTIKIYPDLYDEFKVLGVKHKHSLQKLIDKTIYRYVNEDTFRNDINCFSLPIVSNPSPPSVNIPQIEAVHPIEETIPPILTDTPLVDEPIPTVTESIPIVDNPYLIADTDTPPEIPFDHPPVT